MSLPDPSPLQFEQSVDRPWVRPLRARLADLGLGYEPVFGEVDLEAAELLAVLVSLEAVDPATLPVTWSFRASVLAAERRDERAVLELGGARIGSFAGAFVFELDGRRYGAAAMTLAHQPSVVLAAPSLGELTAVVARVRGEDRALRRGWLQVFGAEGYGQSRRRVRTVDESALVLPDALRRDLMACVDAFLTSPTGSDHRSPSRGMLLLGRPGTGKTLTTRHLLCRLGDARRYLFVRATTGTSPFDNRTFERMVQAIEADDARAVVVIEDVDRLFEGGSTTPQYFLNVLDGMLEPSAPVLWIATSNDPTGIAPNLLDRPGRFDRVFLFPRPDDDARLDLFRLHAVDPIDDDLARELSVASVGLTGAHIREVCHGASLRREMEGVDYGVALRIETGRMKEMHRESRDYERALRGGGGVGFGARG